MGQPRWEVRRLRRPGEIRPILERDAIYAAYALGDLDPEFFPLTEWAGAFLDGEPMALALLYKGLDPYPLITMGDVRGLALILGTAMREPAAYFSTRESHLPAVEGFYALGKKNRMCRMVVRPERFRPVPGLAERLTMRDLPQLQELYEAGGAGYFAPNLLEHGVFYGVRRMGKLVAAAGTHLVSPASGVAAVGNVLTQPQQREQGLATLVTSQVTAELLREGLMVVLNVQADNIAAIRVYQKLGYEKHCEFIESLGHRRPSR